MEKHKIIDMKQIKLDKKYDPEIFLVADFSFDSLVDHKDIARRLKNKNPYIITVIIDNLSPKFWNNKKYVEKTKIEIQPLFRELLYRCFFDEFGRDEGNELYTKWLAKYRPIWKKEKMKRELDDYIIKNELESRYKEKILKKYKNREKLFEPRTEVDRERYYNLPYPLNHIDWRNPYDNIFVWEEDGKKFCRKGGSGSSGGRETNSKFIFGFSLINKLKPITSYLFLYSDDNRLYFIKKFSSLTVPRYDIGSNYFLKNSEEEKILAGVNLIEWKDSIKLKKIKINYQK
jgi:hypothetical protein